MTNLSPPAGMPLHIDPMSAYEQQRAALLAADTSGYVDPHFAEARRDPDAMPEEGEGEMAGGGASSLAADVEPEDDDGAMMRMPEEEGAPDGAAPAMRPPQFRIRPRNELDTAAAWHLRRNPDLSFDEALHLARQELGHGAAPGPDQGEEQDFQGVMDGDEPEAHAQGHPPAHHAFHFSAHRASGLMPAHPEVRDRFLERMAVLDQMLEENRDPLFDSPNKPMILAQMVAREMRAAGLQAGHGQAGPDMHGTMMSMMMQPEATRQRPVRMTAPLAGGTASTNTSRSLLDKQIGEIRSPEDYQRLVGHLIGRKGGR